MTLLLSHDFSGSGAFAGDGVFSNIAGTPPTLVDAGNGQRGLLFPAQTQSLVHWTFTSSTSRKVFEFIAQFSGPTTATAEFAQARGTAKVSALTTQATDGYAIQNSVPNTTNSAIDVITTKHRIQYDVNGTALSCTIFTDDTGTTTAQSPFTQTNAAAQAMSSLRLGWSSATAGGAGVTVLISSVRVADNPADLGPRIYSNPAASWVASTIPF